MFVCVNFLPTDGTMSPPIMPFPSRAYHPTSPQPVSMESVAAALPPVPSQAHNLAGKHIITVSNLTKDQVKCSDCKWFILHSYFEKSKFICLLNLVRVPSFLVKVNLTFFV